MTIPTKFISHNMKQAITVGFKYGGSGTVQGMASDLGGITVGKNQSKIIREQMEEDRT